MRAGSPLRLMLLFVDAIRAWWREFVFLLVLNLLWLLAQASVVLGPPATAALFAVSERVLDGELISFGDFRDAIRRLFRRAWVWGVAQFVVYGILGYDLWVYRDASGLFMLTLRYAWASLLLGWFALNLYYWPLNLVQHDTSLTTTLANAARMALLNPGFTLTYTLAALLLIAASVLSGALLGAVLGAWLALWGTLAVRDRLKVRALAIQDTKTA